ncbi:putative ATP-binding protein (plasmid) [Halanaeroarchaeum sulfurireducens]|uniref:Putative ATP-binding protein n=1 Tax=Halanaeroarchaeum sulfurireducens TaxID=1604004 RepID=A0A0F7PGG4_9EURY|nr:putative ATP-binding protein [Halanaeroarchaeum sulfurireducens]ALG83097.1 putative ATP-binding protein [Halanaeroarchaeum sulfurireducens]
MGKSGAGKTTLFYNIMDQLSVPFWSFDLKQDYRHLLHDRPDLLVLPWSAFKFNPLQPPDGVQPRRWAQVFGEIFGHATSLLSGSKNYLMQQVIKLHQLYDVLDEAAPPYPNLLELQLLIERDPLNYARKSPNCSKTLPSVPKQTTGRRCSPTTCSPRRLSCWFAIEDTFLSFYPDVTRRAWRTLRALIKHQMRPPRQTYSP